jgi:hypothetical protein
MTLVENVYRATRSFPKEEIFGLYGANAPRRDISSRQYSGRRCALRHQGACRFVSIAVASLSELDTHIEIARRLGYLTEDGLAERADAVAGLLMGLERSLKTKAKSA